MWANALNILRYTFYLLQFEMEFFQRKKDVTNCCVLFVVRCSFLLDRLLSSLSYS